MRMAATDDRGGEFGSGWWCAAGVPRASAAAISVAVAEMDRAHHQTGDDRHAHDREDMPAHGAERESHPGTRTGVGAAIQARLASGANDASSRQLTPRGRTISLAYPASW